MGGTASIWLASSTLSRNKLWVFLKLFFYYLQWFSLILDYITVNIRVETVGHVILNCFFCCLDLITVLILTIFCHYVNLMVMQISSSIIIITISMIIFEKKKIRKVGHRNFCDRNIYEKNTKKCLPLKSQLMGNGRHWTWALINNWWDCLWRSNRQTTNYWKRNLRNYIYIYSIF